jgi:hypothetical protein
MNYDEMPAGREMDALVAEKVFGTTAPHRIMAAHHLPPFSTDIEAAWEVVEKMRDRMAGVIYFPPSSVEPPRGSWVAGVQDAGSMVAWFEGMLYGDPPDQILPWSYAETAPLAICRAALKAAA